MNFSEEDLERYSRNIILKEVGIDGQRKIMEGKVLVVGAGGLGSPVALYLAAAGVGVLGLVDGDCVDISNLQRQIIHATADLGKLKVLSAKEKITAVNPGVEVIEHEGKLFAHNIADVINDYDFVIDGTDNFAAKFLINDACVLGGKPFSHGGILRFAGQTMTYRPGEACYRCLFESPPPKDAVPTCSQAGILGSIAGMLGTIQATEALKYLVGTGELLTNRLLMFDALKMEFRTVATKKNVNCPICGENRRISELFDEEPPSCDL